MVQSRAPGYRFIKIPIIFVMITLLNTCGLIPAPAPREIHVDPLRFAKVIEDYKDGDNLNRPYPNSLLFVGSSSIHGWKTLADDFPELNVINRGIGGSHLSDLIYYINDIIYPYQPNAIVMYEGDNDIAAGKTPDVVFNDYKAFVLKIHDKWPDLPIFFLSIKPSIARLDHLENMAKANALIHAYIDQSKTLYYIDVFTPMLGPNGQPRADIFQEDGLHMNADGYAIWVRETRKELGL